MRATMGAAFRTPVYPARPGELEQTLTRSGLPLWGTALREDAEDVRRADLRRGAVVIGSEGRGISEEVLALCRNTLIIPMSPRCESLNAAVAAAVVLWEMVR